MKSKAQIKGHPLHPMLIAFPIAFLSGALIFDVLYLLIKEEALVQTAFYMELAGIIGGMAAAVPGAVDLLYVVPPNSSARNRGVKHALANITAITIFLIAWLWRRQETADFTWIILLEGAG